MMQRTWILYPLLLAQAACQDLTGSQTLGSNVVYPGVVRNAAGAYGIAAFAQLKWQQALASYIVESGLLTDELQSNSRGGPESALSAARSVLIDARLEQISQGSDAYSDLQQVRGMAQQAIGALAKYAGDSSAVRRALLYAFTGYSEVLLADQYCSGIPLSTWSFEEDYRYHPGSSTEEVYRHAITVFDSAIALAEDSLRVVRFAKLGKARALLALGRFNDAAEAVAAVPPDFSYTERIYTCALGSVTCPTAADRAKMNFSDVTVANNEGGKPVVTWTNPRTGAINIGTSLYGLPVYFPEKYVRNGASTIIVASGTEAALIRAEAELHAERITEWLAILNTLRAQHPATDTMAQITDPGAEERIDTLFAERAQWLFLTGHRQGDLRRLLRQHPQRLESETYPSGAYTGRIGSYGTDVTSPLHPREMRNPLFKGCFDRRA